MMVWGGAANVSALIAAGAGIIGAAVGASVARWISSKNNKSERRQRLLQQKLEEFYGPLLAIRSQIKAKSELRLRISQLAGEEWPKLIAAAKGGGVESTMQVEKERFPEYEKVIDSRP